MRKTLITLGALACLVVGVGAVYAAPDATDGTSATTIVADGPFHPRGELLADVLADLVADGTISQAQSDAITGALEDAVEAKRAEMEALRETMQTILEDGEITVAELALLPDDHPLNQLDDLLDDGKITIEELRGLRGGFGFGGGRHHGFGLFRPDVAPEAGN